VHLQSRIHESPSDPKRAWFSESLVLEAEQVLRGNRGVRSAEPARYVDAATARERWAREHGCSDFAQAMAIGLQRVGRGALSGHASTAQQHVAPPAREIMPAESEDPQYADWAAATATCSPAAV
jgi:hypothetical protein